MQRVLDDLIVFCQVVELGSLKQASLALAIPHSTVSRRIEKLEDNLGFPLLYRTTRHVTPTQRGKQLFDDCKPLLKSVDQAIKIAVNDEHTYRGQVKVSLPVRAGIDFLGEWLLDFASQFDGLVLDIQLSNRNENLAEQDIDLAFRVGPLPDASAIASYLWDIPYAVYATPAMVEQYGLNNGVTLQQLETLPAAVARPAKRWFFETDDNDELAVSPNERFVVDDLGLVRSALLTDKALGMLPMSMAKNEGLESITLIEGKPRTRKMYAYYLGRRHPSSFVKQMINYVRARHVGQLACSGDV